jgi:hypothetical protein
MSRKKRANKPPEAELTTSTETVEPEFTPVVAMPHAKPAWIDGAPVAADGQFIREGSSRPSAQMQLSDQVGGEPPPESGEQKGKNWGDPHKSIFTCPEMGFELGENRRFKQRVFRFAEKPGTEILAQLKEHGFTYRTTEKAWTINATPQSRKLTDELARKWAGPNYMQSPER